MQYIIKIHDCAKQNPVQIEHILKIYIYIRNFKACLILTVKIEIHYFFLRFYYYNKHMCGQNWYQFYRLTRIKTRQNWQFSLLKTFQKGEMEGGVYTFKRNWICFFLFYALKYMYGTYITTNN